jgi:threonine/homoserine/homoserine lactone efflux protein
MTIDSTGALLYAGSLLILFMTPGPVWVALIARALSGGFQSAWPLALGVALGDFLWPIVAILGVSVFVTQFEEFMTILRYLASVIFFAMGYSLIRNSDRALGSDSRLTRPGMMAGFVSGIAVIVGNPKAILFYVGVLPGFFDLTHITWRDALMICTLSFVVPLTGNMFLAVFFERIRPALMSKAGLKRVNLISGVLLILVGWIIPFT